MWTENYQWHYDYIRLAWDTGFSFEKCKSPDLNKNQICLVDIDRIVRERDVASVDRFIPTVIQYILDNDQAEVLDTNFVKMFRISQLSVEYLLFCKKYLDNTMVLLKKDLSKLREENKELESYNKELESHINTLTKINPSPTFKCSKCSKLFSSEEYLNSHTNRRHAPQDNEIINKTSETVQLQSEIKCLKERLNNTEKLVHEKNDNSTNDQETHENKLKMTDIQQKFDTFKQDVERELEHLKMQKTFYEEKYGKLFELIMTQNDRNIATADVSKNKPKTLDQKEHTTQTDSVVLKKENFLDRNVFSFQEDAEKYNEIPASSNVTPEIEKKISQFEITVEKKISSTLQHIEGQMQAFWEKFSEFESHKTCEEIVDTEPKIRPPIKPRSKFSQPTKPPILNLDIIKKLRPEIEKLEAQENKAVTVTFLKQPDICNTSESVSESEDQQEPASSLMKDSGHGKKLNTRQGNLEAKKTKASELKFVKSYEVFQSSESIIESEEVLEPIVAKKVLENLVTKSSASTLGKRSLTSLRKVKDNKKVIDKLGKEVESIMTLRLQELGVSPSWKGLPDKSFTKILEIINHQANLTAKVYPNFYKTKEDIKKSLESSHDIKGVNKDEVKKKTRPSPLNQQKQNIIHIGYRKKSRRLQKPEASVINPEKVTIKNRSLYDTDTESENLAATSKNETKAIGAAEKKFSAVIEELKIRDNTRINNDGVRNQDSEIPAKGVLKNYPSMGAISKKKVLFNIDSDSSKGEDLPVVQVVGGSTTSIASSIFDGKQDKDTGSEKNFKKTNDLSEKPFKKANDIESFSDFDLSDL